MVWAKRQGTSKKIGPVKAKLEEDLLDRQHQVWSAPTGNQRQPP